MAGSRGPRRSNDDCTKVICSGDALTPRSLAGLVVRPVCENASMQPLQPDPAPAASPALGDAAPGDAVPERHRWTIEGTYPVAPGVHRIPLPLPFDGLRAVNTYA